MEESVVIFAAADLEDQFADIEQIVTTNAELEIKSDTKHMAALFLHNFDNNGDIMITVLAINSNANHS